MTKHSEKQSRFARIQLPLIKAQHDEAKAVWESTTERRAQWIILARDHGLTWKEIGDLLGEDQNTVRMIATRYRGKTFSTESRWLEIISETGGELVTDTVGLQGEFLYIVQWPDGTTKIGSTGSRSRWRKFVCRGAELLMLASFPPTGDSIVAETLIQEDMARNYPLRFQSRDESLDHLGDGSGYLECYSMEVDRG